MIKRFIATQLLGVSAWAAKVADQLVNDNPSEHHYHAMQDEYPGDTNDDHEDILTHAARSMMAPPVPQPPEPEPEKPLEGSVEARIAAMSRTI